MANVADQPRRGLRVVGCMRLLAGTPSSPRSPPGPQVASECTANHYHQIVISSSQNRVGLSVSVAGSAVGREIAPIRSLEQSGNLPLIRLVGNLFCQLLSQRRVWRKGRI